MKALKIILIIGLVVVIALAVFAVEDIRSTSWKLNRMALSFQNDMLCSFHKTLQEQDKCYGQYAFKLNSSDSCLNIEKEEKRDYCLIKALFLGNRIDCEDISDSYLESSCGSITKYGIGNEQELEEYVFET